MLARARQANWWEEGEYQVWVLRGDCEITQANLTARSEEAVLWVKRPDTFHGELGCALAYLEGDVCIESSRVGAAHLATQRSADTVRANQWFGRFYSSTEIRLTAPSTSFEPQVKPAVYERGRQAHEADAAGAVRQAQFSPRLPGWVPPPPACPCLRGLRAACATTARFSSSMAPRRGPSGRPCPCGCAARSSSASSGSSR